MQIAISCVEEELLTTAQHLATKLDLPLLSNQLLTVDFILQVTNSGLQLVDVQDKKSQILKISFTDGKNFHRLNYGGGKNQMLAKACGLTKTLPMILDVTAGLGADAFVLASLGCKVTMCERNKLLTVLLEDALNLAKTNAEVAVIINKINLINIDAVDLLNNLAAFLPEKPQVIYLDPMFPMRSKTALVKKNMQILHKLNLDSEQNNELLFNLALENAHNRVVVKRPKSAKTITSFKPSYSLQGKSNRFDIYTKNRF